MRRAGPGRVRHHDYAVANTRIDTRTNGDRNHLTDRDAAGNCHCEPDAVVCGKASFLPEKTGYKGTGRPFYAGADFYLHRIFRQGRNALMARFFVGPTRIFRIPPQRTILLALGMLQTSVILPQSPVQGCDLPCSRAVCF